MRKLRYLCVKKDNEKNNTTHYPYAFKILSQQLPFYQYQDRIVYDSW